MLTSEDTRQNEVKKQGLPNQHSSEQRRKSHILRRISSTSFCFAAAFPKLASKSYPGVTFTLAVALFAVGLIVGFYSGLIGTGGNVLLIPALDILFTYLGIPEAEMVKFIIAQSLFVTMFTGVTVSFRQYRAGNFFLKEMLLTAVPGTVTAYFVTEIIRNGNWYEKRSFDIVFLALLIVLALRLFLSNARKASLIDARPGQWLFPFVGLLTGVATSLSGLGGGVVLIPAFTDLMKMPIKSASSISIGVVAVLAVPISLSYLLADISAAETQVLPWQIGYISLGVILPLILGIFATAPLGVKAGHKANPRTLMIIFGGVVSVLCLKLVYGLWIA
tara:strand:+ start:2907 stop:3905 length:999 start_codon:yes stop_codon:yes gene_type:complete